MAKVQISAKSVNIAKVSLVALAAAFGAAKIGTMQPVLKDAVAALASYYNLNQKGDIAQCDVCGGRSPADLSCCPYCGDGAEVEAKAEVVTEPKAEAKAEAKAEVVTEPKAEAKKGRTKKAKEVVTEPKAEATAEAKAEAKAEVVTETKAIVKASSKTAIALETPAFATAKLDAAVADVQSAKARGAVAMWDLGAKIARIYDEQLFKSRLADDGKPVYKGFEAFVVAELGMSHTNAFSLMDVAKAFTSEQVAKLGTTKLSLVLKAPDESREEILGKAAHKSVREVADEVKAARAEKGKPAPKSDRKQPHGDTGEKVRKAKRAEGTIDLPARKLSITLLTESGKPAKRLADEPAGEVVVSEGIALRVSIVVNDDSTLSAVVRFVVTE